MNNKFDELANGLAQSVALTLVSLAVGTQIITPCYADGFRLSPLIDLSDPDSFAGCDIDGRPSNGMEKECSVAVNPTNPKNLAVAWIASRYKGIGTAVSFDGGKRWQQGVIPGVTPCTGGTSLIVGDPWLTFAPNGDLYAMYGSGDILKIFGGSLATGDLRVNQVSKSTDGGLHWSDPITVFTGTNKLTTTDKPSITADPTDARFVYAVWNVLASGNRGQAVLSRTTDGGQTWEPARIIYDPGVANNEAFGLQVLVLPNGTVVGFFIEEKFQFDGSSNDKQALLSVIRSSDKGLTWSAPIRIATEPLFNTTDPDTSEMVDNAGSVGLFAVAVDAFSGSLYVVWEDTRFSGGQYGSIAFSMSADSGLTWSSPIQVNQTPASLPPANRQALLPSIAVAADGTIGVTYYDFRFNDPSPGLPTDYWFVHCHPSATTAATNSANWSNEVRLTDASFDIETARTPLGEIWVGDYEGLATVGSDFLATWSQPHDTDPDSIFFRRVGP